MNDKRFITGFRKALIYVRIGLHVAVRYAVRPRTFGWSPVAYVRFLSRAAKLLFMFRHNKVVRVLNGYKLHLYLPAYPTQAFFYAIEAKLTRRPAGPTTLVFSMTKACTYKCKHCYQRHDAGKDLDEDLMIETALKAHEAGVAMFDIEGGEPFVRFPRLLKLVTALDEHNEIWVNTTGANMTEEQLEQLQREGLFGLMVSVHSPDASKHDELTGIDGAFDTACAAIAMCKCMGMVAAINAVLSEEEVRAGELDRLMEFARDSGADYVQLIHPKPAGLWLGRTEGMQHDARVIEGLRDEHLRYNSPAMQGYPSLAAQVFEESESVLGCTAGGVDRFYINAHGEVQPCEFLNISFGNVNDEPFEVIFDRMRSYFGTPCCDWLCCTQAGAIHECLARDDTLTTPLPWALTRDLVQEWERGKATPIYDRLGIYP